MGRLNGCNAFTLIELLIVVAIIGILAAIAIPNFQNAKVRAKIANVYGDFNSLSNALSMYRLDRDTYPGKFMLHAKWEFLTTPIAYLASIPRDPFPVFSVNDLELGQNTTYYSYSYTPCKGTEPRNKLQGKSNVKFDNYLLVSYGPNFSLDSDIRVYPDSEIFLIYDLSNGSRSDGDIVHETHPGLPEYYKQHTAGNSR